MRGERAQTLDVHKSCVDSIGRAPREVGVLCWHVARLMPISLYSLQELTVVGTPLVWMMKLTQ